jgi:hypothetical protein
VRVLRTAVIAALLVFLPGEALAHVGSPDVVHEGKAGPYAVVVSIVPPQVVPGVAEVEVDTTDTGVDAVKLVPMPLQGDGARFAPTPDDARLLAGTESSYVGRLWMMSAGSWQVKVTVFGARGKGELAVPVPSLPRHTGGMQASLGVLLLALLVFLVSGVVSIVGASVREAQLPPGARPGPAQVRRSRIARTVTAVLALLAVWGGNAWWNAEAHAYDRYVYKPLQIEAKIDEGLLSLELVDPGWLKMRRVDDLVPDHDHLMHLYMIRTPEMDRVYHLHPVSSDTSGRFTHPLPPDVSAGHYRLYADVVHATGLPETAVTDVDVPPSSGSPYPDPDDTGATAPPIASGALDRTLSPLSSGTMVFVRDGSPLRSDRIEHLVFRVDDEQGLPATDLELFMGMQGHAAILHHDQRTFAHIHPSGSVPMAALALTSGSAAAASPPSPTPHGMGGMHDMPGMAGMMMPGMPDRATLPSSVSFPYRFPRPGPYRIFVQVKRRGRVETGTFDFQVQ